MSDLPSKLFPEWDVLLDAPADQDAAIATFLKMARADAKEPGAKETTLRVKNYSAPAAHPYRVRFRLRDPDPAAGHEGDQDHVLFKADGDSHGRPNKGRRRPEHYQAGRAARIAFIPLVHLDPQFVYRIKNEQTKVFYVRRTGSDEWFVVLLDELAGNPRFNFNTAYMMTDAEYRKERTEWDRVFPNTPRPPKKKRKR